MNAPEGPTVAELVTAAQNKDRGAWNQIVDRFSGLVIATARRYRLPEHDVADVAQTVWLHLVEHLTDLREPAALPGWLVSTTRHECVRTLGRQAKQRPLDPQLVSERTTTGDFAVDVTDNLDRLTKHQAMLAGLAELSDADRQLLSLLVTDPPMSYAQISQLLGIPIGSIGPTRGRALQRLRATTPVSRLVDRDD